MIGNSLVEEFARLWRGSTAPPSLSDFLRAHPRSTPQEMLQVVLVDQRERWRAEVPWSVEE